MGQWDSRPSTIFTSSQLTMLTIFFKLFLMGHLSQWCHFRHNRTFVQRNVIYFHYCGTVGQLSQQKKSEKKLDYVSSQHDVDERITGVTEISWTFVTIMGHFSQCWDFWLQKCHKSVKWDSGTAVPLKKKLKKKRFFNFPSWLG